MVVARGDDQDNPSLERFALYGEPQRIKAFAHAYLQKREGVTVCCACRSSSLIEWSR